MSGDERNGWFDGIETVISDPLRFKARLEIGDNVYASARLKNKLSMLWEAAGSGATAAAIAGSAPVASTFFAPTGVLAFLGIGTAATPIGWLLAAGIVVGGGWIGVTRYLQKSIGSRTTTVPDFINTPMDILGVALFDLMAPLSLKVAAVDGEIDPAERQAIRSYFVDQWGFDPAFVEKGMAFLESRLSDFSIREQAQSLAAFKKQNKDCNYKEMSRHLLGFLRDIIEADGRIDEREEMALEEVQRTYRKVARFRFRESTTKPA